MAVGGILPMPVWVLGGDPVGVGAGGRKGEAVRLVWFGRFVGCAGTMALWSVLALLSLRGDPGRPRLGHFHLLTGPLQLRVSGTGVYIGA